MSRGGYLLLLLLLVVMPALGDQSFDQAFQSGKQAAGSIQKPDPSANPDVVPGYDGANPQERQYYNNPSQIESAATAAAETNPAAESVRDSYNNRPKFNLDPNTDPLINRSTAISDNPQGVVGVMQDGYSDCKTETTGTEGVPTQSVCQSFTNITTHTCDEVLKVTCQQSQSQCPMAQAMFVKSNSDVTATYSTSSYQLSFWSDQWRANEAKGAVFDREVNFNVPDKNEITTFKATYARYDDWIRIRINGTVIHVGPPAGDRLELTGGGPFGFNRVFYTATQWGFPEQDKFTTNFLNVDLRPYLRNGNNEIHVRTITAGSGRMETRFTIIRRCPCDLNETWDDSACEEYQ